MRRPAPDVHLSAAPAPPAGANRAVAERGTIVSLQVLRGVAALLVVLHHAGAEVDGLAARGSGRPLAVDAVLDGAFGVHLFFVISGFIMVTATRRFGGLHAAGDFLLRRLVRIVPLYWILTTLVLAGAIVAPSLLNQPVGSWRTILGSYLFIPVLRGNEIRPVLGQGWTLNYEMEFYLIFAATLLLPRSRALPLVGLVLVGLVAAGRILPLEGAAAVTWTDTLLLEFLYGVGLACLASARRLPAWLALVLGLGGAFAALGPGLVPAVSDGLDSSLRWGVLAAAIVAAAVLGPDWPRAGVIAGLAVIGDASYSLYLSHPFVVRLMRVAWVGAGGDASQPVVLLIFLMGAATLLALALFRFVEQPMTRRLQRAVRGRSATERTAA